MGAPTDAGPDPGDAVGQVVSAAEETSATSTTFLGTFSPRLDDKFRISLPARYREDLASGLVVTRGQERCLFVYTRADFQLVFDKLRAAPTTRGEVRHFVRLFLSGALEETPDKQGRITVPPMLREWAGLSKDCTVIGAGARLEVWDAKAWQTYLSNQESHFASVSDEVMPGF